MKSDINDEQTNNTMQYNLLLLSLMSEWSVGGARARARLMKRET